MIALLSPAKTLDFESPVPAGIRPTKPRLLADSAELVAVLRRLSVANLQSLMDISPALAELNVGRFASWTDRPDRRDARPAILAFRGDVYRGFDVDSLDAAALESAARRVRILSGLYGLLRPLDAILPHRLEMGTSLPNARGGTLHEFWGDRITRRLERDLRDAGARAVVNLASAEYARSVRMKDLPVPVVTPVFREVRDGRSRTLALFAKEARGMMARFIATEALDDPEGLKDFRGGGYRYQPRDSDAGTLVFSRPQPPPPGSARKTGRTTTKTAGRVR